MKLAPEIHEFFVEGGDPEESHALLHITEPSTAEEMPKGYFFALAEIENGTTEQIEHLQQMIEDLESGYYETDAIQNRDPFETTIEYINRRGHHVLAGSDAAIHCLVGVFRGGDVIFSYHGSPNVTLYYQGKNGLEYLPVLEGENEEESSQLFSALLQGKVNPGDYFVIASPGVTEYFSPDRLGKLLISRTTEETAAHMEKVLKDLKGAGSFAGVIFHIPGRRYGATDDQNSAESLLKLQDTERETEAIISPPLFGDTKKKLQALFASRQKRKKETKKMEGAGNDPEEETNIRPRGHAKESVLGMILIAIGRALVIGAVGVFHLLRNLGIGIVRMGVGVFLLVTNKGNKRREVITAWKRYAHQRRAMFHSMPLVSKMLLTATILCAVLFVGSLSYLKVKERQAHAAEKYQNLVASIRDRKAAAEGSVIYGNDDKAFLLLQEARQLLAALPTNSKDQKTNHVQLASGIEAALKKIRKIVSVTPQIIADLTEAEPKTTADKLAQIDDQLIAYGSTDTNLYRVDLATKKVDAKAHDPLFHLSLASTPKEQNIILFGTADGMFAEYNKDNGTLSTKNITFPFSHPSLADAVVYNQKLYALDAGNKHIYKFTPTQTGYDKGAVWSKSGEEGLANGVSLTIDGDIFVLTKTGLIKYVAGVPQDFPLAGLDPALNNPSSLWTYNDLNNIYILEPTNKRLVVLDKNGKLVAQYTSSLWNHPTDMIVNEAKKTVYVIDNNKIYLLKML